MRKIAAVAVVGLTASSCVTLYGNAVRADAVHRVTVTSTPPDAQVFVGGKHVGATPVRIAVSNGDPGPVVTIEKDCYLTYRRRVERAPSLGRVAASIGIGVGIGLAANMAMNARYEGDGLDTRMAIGGVPLVIDWASGALVKFPDRIDALLASNPECRRQERERPRRLRRPRGLRGSLNLNRPPAARPSAVSFQPLPRRTMQRERRMDQSRSPSVVHQRIGQAPDPGALVLMDGRRR